MSINPELQKLTELKPRIVVVGVGGAGGNAINNMIASGLESVEYVAANTDAQALVTSSAECRLQLGVNLTEGLGAGSKPEIGEAAAEEAIEEIGKKINGAHMVFIAAGMGGGTGTGAAAVIARAARDLGILTVGIVTKPFQFEGSRRMRTAEAGIAELRKYVDTLIVIPNQNLFRIATEKTTFAEAFMLADQVLYSGVACIVDLIVKDGLINLDFADVRTVMSGMGTAMMGTGEAEGENRAIRAAEEAISNPLLDEVSLKGAKGVLLSIIGGNDMTLYDVDEAASRVRQEVDPEANIIVGAAFDEQLGESVRVAIVASGLNATQTNARQAALDAGAGLNVPPFHASSAPAGMPPLPASGTGQGAQHNFARSTPPPLRPQASTHPEPHLAAGPPSQSLAARLSQQPRELWRSPTDVIIEETHAPGMGSTSTAGRAPHREEMPPEPVSRFEPSAPEEVRRPSSRRMPGLDEFPPVGQREYRAKASRFDTAPEGHERSASRMSPDQEQRSRGGLLQRMIGTAKKSIRQ